MIIGCCLCLIDYTGVFCCGVHRKVRKRTAAEEEEDEEDEKGKEEGGGAGKGRERGKSDINAKIQLTSPLFDRNCFPLPASVIYVCRAFIGKEKKKVLFDVGVY